MPPKNNASPADALPMEREITIVRVFDAPPDLVFAAWTEPRHMSQWFGPKHWTNPVCDLDVKPGGAWRIVMRDPNGGDYPCGGVYREIVRERAWSSRTMRSTPPAISSSKALPA